MNYQYFNIPEEPIFYPYGMPEEPMGDQYHIPGEQFPQFNFEVPPHPQPSHPHQEGPNEGDPNHPGLFGTVPLPIPTYHTTYHEERGPWSPWSLYHTLLRRRDSLLVGVVHNALELSLLLERNRAGDLYQAGEGYYFLKDGYHMHALTNEIKMDIVFYRKTLEALPAGYTTDEIQYVGIEWKRLLRGLMRLSGALGCHFLFPTGIIGARVSVVPVMVDGMPRNEQIMTVLLNGVGFHFQHVIRHYIESRILSHQRSNFV